MCDSNTGLHHLNHQGDYTNLISSGSFCDACLSSTDKIYALNYKQGEIHTFSKIQNSWAKGTQFKLVQYGYTNYDDKLCTTSTHVYVSSWNNHCILVYTLSGEFVYKTGEHGGEVGEFDFPLLSDVDSEGKLLVCDYWNSRLQVFYTQIRKWDELKLKDVREPWCAGVREKHLSVVSGYPQSQLVKYEVV